MQRKFPDRPPKIPRSYACRGYETHTRFRAVGRRSAILGAALVSRVDRRIDPTLSRTNAQGRLALAAFELVGARMLVEHTNLRTTSLRP
jgi:hypothetical protein